MAGKTDKSNKLTDHIFIYTQEEEEREVVRGYKPSDLPLVVPFL